MGCVRRQFNSAHPDNLNAKTLHKKVYLKIIARQIFINRIRINDSLINNLVIGICKLYVVPYYKIYPIKTSAAGYTFYLTDNSLCGIYFRNDKLF